MNEPDAPQQPADAATIAPGAVQGKPDTAQAFISYASADISIANAVCSALERAGVKCWIAPRDVAPGELYAANIVHAIDTTRLVVLILSQHAADSAHVLREVERACSKRHTILSFRTDLAQLPEGLEYFLNTSQWLDASEIGVDRTLPRLVEAVKSVLAKPTLAAPVSQSQRIAARPNHPLRRLLMALGVLIVTALVYVGVDRLWLAKRNDTQTTIVETPTELPSASSESVTASDKSIAVLPFADMSAGKDQEYFADGLSEELLNLLAKLPELRVIGRTSSFQFKGKNEDLRVIGEKLNVAHILEGSVRKSDEKLRITAQLIRAVDGSHIWSESYDRTLDDVFAVQDDIAGEVVKALKLTLLGTTSTTRSRSADPEAYNLVLQGSYFYMRGKLGDEAKAVELFQRATVRDPNYAVAWAKLSRALGWQGYIGDLAADDAMARGRSAAERALEIDPNCAEAYYARGNISRVLAGEWEAALSDYEKTAALDPNGQVGGEAKGNALMLRAEMSGHTDAIIDWSNLWLESSPLDGQRMYDLAWLYQVDGNLEASAAMFRRLLDMNPDWSTGPTAYGVTLLLMGKHVEALAAVNMEPDDSYRLFGLTVVYWALDRRAESDSALDALKQRFPTRKAYEIASAHAYRGEETAAFAWLDRAYQQQRGSLEILKVDPLFQGLHKDPRFGAWLRKAKLSH